MATAPSPPSWNNTLLLHEEEVDLEMPPAYGVTTDYEKSEQFQDYSGKRRGSLIDLQRQASEAKNAEEINHRHVLQLNHLNLVTPDQKHRLIHDLNVTVTSGQHLLICGASGVGKSSLLRAIAGLWRTGHGSILRPADEDICFLPQQPYCTSGSLRDQLLYPASMQNVQEHPDEISDWSFQSAEFIPEDSSISSSSQPIQANIADEELIRILEKINLKEIAIRAGDGNPIKGLKVVLDWSHVLSLGEKQRLAFGRLLVHCPKRLVVLDEATSALDLYNETCMYRILQEIAADSATSMTYVSVGHRPSLAEFHTMRLELGKSAEDDNTTEKNIPSVY